ncbi:meiotic recombination protein REC114 isoform X1 [Scyliorhinus canicula]|uniref:meiotic recombination protein REC114 isoform X1 n=1 Tax=Scyliorhinus canicula TaxID=7830 RepID=UPI0018F4F666|nr:meiotic recombination protein REC114 isoform X1 [Scyliorhinus canicula]
MAAAQRGGAARSEVQLGPGAQAGPLLAHSSRPEAVLPSTQWPLKRYGRFLPQGGGPRSWEVFESIPEKGFLSLTIVQSGHFLISQGGATLLEGFSLIDAHKWWKAVRRADCVLFGSKVKNESRMFRVQFSGDLHKQALERCSACVQMLLQYIDVQNPDGNVQNQALQLSQPTNISLSGSLELESQGRGLEVGQIEAQSTLLEGRVSMKQLAKIFGLWEETRAAGENPRRHGEKVQTPCGHPRLEVNPGAWCCWAAVLTTGPPCCPPRTKSMLGATSPELPLAYQQSTLNAEELGPFLRLCLLDQGFPEFVEQVEQELKKLIDA